MVRTAFITGINGQDGSYLAELLLDKGYYVYGIVRRSSNINTHRLNDIYNHPNLKFYYGDMTDAACLQKYLLEIVSKHSDIEQFEIYNLAGQSHVKVSFDIPEYTCQVNAIGTLNLLECLKYLPLEKEVIRFYQAGTSEMYGHLNDKIALNEETPFNPVSPYAISKHTAFQYVKMYREAYDYFACNGILFNHESSRRGETFVTRKVVIGVNNIINKKQDLIELGNINSIRDWGHAKDYVYGMWLMLQAKYPDDYVLGSGETYSVKEFVDLVFKLNGMPITWKGDGEKTVAVDNEGNVRVRINPKYYRPLEVPFLKADYTKASTILKWKPKYSLLKLVEEMIEEEKLR